MRTLSAIFLRKSKPHCSLPLNSTSPGSWVGPRHLSQEGFGRFFSAHLRFFLWPVPYAGLRKQSGARALVTVWSLAQLHISQKPSYAGTSSGLRNFHPGADLWPSGLF
ncbi:hypothetical protein ACOMHN_017963 [Nucella lapillus]